MLREVRCGARRPSRVKYMCYNALSLLMKHVKRAALQVTVLSLKCEGEKSKNESVVLENCLVNCHFVIIQRSENSEIIRDVFINRLHIFKIRLLGIREEKTRKESGWKHKMKDDTSPKHGEDVLVCGAMCLCHTVTAEHILDKSCKMICGTRATTLFVIRLKH